MSRPELILPQADASCGKLFFPDRRTADGHRVGLEVWNRATGRKREGYRLAVYRCKRCGGYHIGYKAIDRDLSPPQAHQDFREEVGHEIDTDRSGPHRGSCNASIRRSAYHEAAWA